MKISRTLTWRYSASVLRRSGVMVAFVVLILPLPRMCNAQVVGPPKGTLLLDGGAWDRDVLKEFAALAGGPDAKLAIIITARAERENDPERIDGIRGSFAYFGIRQITIVHTRDRQVANSPKFNKPLQAANAVWLTGGDPVRLIDAYEGTQVERELRGVLDRGGIIGGTSAGAMIQGSFLVEDRPELIRGHEAGFAYVKNVTIMPHLVDERREEGLAPVITKHKQLLGIGLDSPAAIVVRGDNLEVIGHSVVAIYDGSDHTGKPYYFLHPGDRFDLRLRRPE